MEKPNDSKNSTKVDIEVLRGDIKRIETMLKMSIAEQQRFNNLVDKRINGSEKYFEKLEARVGALEIRISNWSIYNKAVVLIISVFTILNLVLRFWR